MTVNNKEENSSDFFLDFVQEFSLRYRLLCGVTISNIKFKYLPVGKPKLSNDNISYCGSGLDCHKLYIIIVVSPCIQTKFESDTILHIKIAYWELKIYFNT
jgi:hypothetical protein